MKNAIAIGGIIGLMTVSRPTEIVSIFIPLLWGVDSLTALKARLTEIFKLQQKKYLSATLVGFIIIFPQLLYWKLTTGHWIFDSYHNPGEGLDLLSPHTFPFLFSFRKGWWIYTPIMFLATLGLISLYKNNKSIFWSFLIFFILNLYLVSSWTCWWYASSFSSRAMVQSYPMMCVLLGFFLFKRKKWEKPLVVCLFLLLSFNLFQTWQYHKNILAIDRMTFAYYTSVFGQITSPSAEQLELLSIDHGITEIEDYGNHEKYLMKKTMHVFNQPNVISSNNIYSKTIKIPYYELTDKEYIWLRCIANVEAYSTAENYSCHLAVCLLHKGEPYKWMSLPIQNLNLKPNKACKIKFDYLTPVIRSTNDKISVGFWHQNGDSLKINNLKVEVWEPLK